MLIKLFLDAVVLKMTNVFSTPIAKQLWESALTICRAVRISRWCAALRVCSERDFLPFSPWRNWLIVWSYMVLFLLVGMLKKQE